jgi:hypothetical protein
MQIIAQGIECYYWQGTNCNSQEFFTKTGELLQNTTAKGASFDRGDNKAASSVSSWLAPITNDHGEFYFPAIGTTFYQWNVSSGSAGVAATLRDATKSQIYIGGTGADTYKFSGSWGSDTILDSDGQGSIVIDGVTLQGGKKVEGVEGMRRNTEQGYSHPLVGEPGNQSLVISRDSGLSTVRVQGWGSRRCVRSASVGNALAIKFIAAHAIISAARGVKYQLRWRSPLNRIGSLRNLTGASL